MSENDAQLDNDAKLDRLITARAAERRAMIEHQLIPRGIRDPRVRTAIQHVPREHFFPADRIDNAYVDAAHAIDCDQTISQPYIVALMSSLLELHGGERVLEIGTGSGYQTAILAHLARDVFTVERHAVLASAAAHRLKTLNLTNIHYHTGDGTLGWTEHAPYDAILVTAGAPRVPDELLDQLADPGTLVIPVGDESAQTLTRITQHNARFETQTSIGCRFVKLRGHAGWQD